MSKFHTLGKIVSELHVVKKKLPILVPLMIVYVLFLASSPYFYMLLIDGLEKNLSVGSMGVSLVGLIALWLIAIVSTIGMRYWYAMLLLKFAQEDWFQFLLKSMRMMMSLPLDYHISHQHGEKQKTLERAGEAVWGFGDSGMLHIFPQFLVSVILIVSGCFIDARMTLISLILLPFAIFGIHFLGNSAYTNQSKANKYWDQLFNRVSDVFTNLKIIRIFAREKNETSILQNIFGYARIAQNDIRKLWILFNGMNVFFTTLAQAITLSGGIYFLHNHEISLGTLFFFIGFTERIYGPIFVIFEQMQVMLLNIAGFEKMQALFEMKPETDKGTKEFGGIAQTIHFENVSFVYPTTSRQVLNNVHIEISKGQKVALIGHTGSGKSTIVQLLMRFYDTAQGTICIDGTPITEFQLSSYRSKFASVFQDTTLFNDSIRHNLEYIRDGLTLQDLEKACREANILEFIQSLPETWNTEVGERGLKLSGGEKQRLAIARAILADPEILILDEATSAMDTETEKLIQDSLETLMKGRTSIIIAHRLSTIQNVDCIYMLKEGNIIASGSHAELLKTCEPYQRLIAMQHSGFVGDEEEQG